MSRAPFSRLTSSQAKRLDLALRRRNEGHSITERNWVRTVADLVSSGASVKAIAEHLGLSRQAVYDWLDKARRS
jgi:transposase-like protein